MILIDKHPLTIIVGSGTDKIIDVIHEYHRKNGCVADFNKNFEPQTLFGNEM